jgi:guanosine-3',5'-bis(diphosphate) 3'-pyrophosphohydrolase
MTIDYGIYQKTLEEKKNLLLNNVRSRMTTQDVDIVNKAYEVASQAHINQKRKSGEPYIIHPLEVALTINEWGLDSQVIAAALLHDVIEDSDVTKTDIEQIFNRHIADLVSSVTKLKHMAFENEQAGHAEYFRRMFLAMANDIKVILIKLADRLNNIRTLNAMPVHKHKRIALETAEIYVPIANKIGLHSVYAELANTSFKYLYPNRYNVLEKAVRISKNKYIHLIENLSHNISIALSTNGITATPVCHEKSIYNLYQWMKRRRSNFTKIYSIFDVKIIVNNIRDCYLSVGVLHNLFQPIPGKFKDFIAIPKSNGYQSLHVTVMGPDATPLHIHIRTLAMDEIAENGLIASLLENKEKPISNESLEFTQRTHKWLNNILDIESSAFSANDFLENIKQDFTPNDIYVFTPKSQIIVLPTGATVLDFAYFVHTDIGNHFQQALVNQKAVKANHILKNGDIVEVITNANIHPTEEWLSLVTTGKSITKVKYYLKSQNFDLYAKNGLKSIKLLIYAIDPTFKFTVKILEKIVTAYYPNLTVNDLRYQVGIGTISVISVVKNILNFDHKNFISIKLSNCKHLKIIQDEDCLALPDEDITGLMNHHDELFIHKSTCDRITGLNIKNILSLRLINDNSTSFATKIQLTVLNRPGVFAKLSGVFGDNKVNILELSQPSSINTETARVFATLGITGINEIAKIISQLRSKDFVQRVDLI